MEKSLIVVRFRDTSDNEIIWDTAFFTELSEYELLKKMEEIVEKFENRGFDDYSFEDIIAELKKQNLIEEPDFSVEWYEIFVQSGVAQA